MTNLTNVPKTILLTGATDGIGLATANRLVAHGHTVLLHGRNPAKLDQVATQLRTLPGAGAIHQYVADLSRLNDVEAFAQAVSDEHDALDALINNAGVLKTSTPRTGDNLDLRFVVNTIAPYLLTKRLLPRLHKGSRIVNLSSAAQAPVQLDALAGRTLLDDMPAYAQSKLALTMWSRSLARALGEDGPVVIAVNPGSLLATKMVREGFGVPGSDVAVGASILVRLALDDEFASASGQYFDNDAGRIGPPHPDALNDAKCDEVVRAIEAMLTTTASAA